MQLSSEVVQGRYLEDILDQPRALHATWKSLCTSHTFDCIARSCHPQQYQRVVLTGMGSSYFGLYPLSMELVRHGWIPIMLETSELVHYFSDLLTPSTLLVAVSQSGRSAETLRLLELNTGKATLIGVTNVAESPLAEESDFPVLTAAGEESSVSCKTYVTAQMALSVVAAVLCQLDSSRRLRDFQATAEAADLYLRDWETHVDELAGLLHDSRDLFLVGRGPSLAAACTGALIIKESARFHAEGMSSAAFRHGPFEMLKPGVSVGIFDGDEITQDLNERLLHDVEKSPARALSFSIESEIRACRIPQVTQAARPILEILPVQMSTLALAALAKHEAGKFERATKVTTIE